MSGKINLCGIQFDYQNLVRGIMNMNINFCNNNLEKDTSTKTNYEFINNPQYVNLDLHSEMDYEMDCDTHITKEDLDKQLIEYMNHRNYILNIENNHKYCHYKCQNMKDWVNHPLDDYIKHQEECEKRYMDLFTSDNMRTILKINSNVWHPKYYLKINSDKIDYYINLLGLESV